MKRLTSRSAFAVGVIAVGVLGIGVGTAVASGPTALAPAGLQAEPGAHLSPMASPTYPRNSQGLSYGSAASADTPSHEPDLILVVATNGKQGYAKKTELDAADGTTASKSFKSPSDAAAWQAGEGRKDHAVAVYDVTGTTVIGQFVVAGADTQKAQAAQRKP